MSLRLRLFLLIGGLIALLASAQWWWMRSLTEDLQDQAGQVAFLVGESVVSAFVDEENLGRHRIRLEDGAGVVTTSGTTGSASPHRQSFDFEVRSESKLRNTAESQRDDKGEPAPDRPRRIQIVTESRTEHTIELRERQVDDRGVTREWIAVPDAETLGESASRLEFHQVSSLHPSAIEASQIDTDAALSPEARRIVLRLLEQDGKESELLLGDANLLHRIPIPSSPLVQPLERFSERFLLGSVAILLLGLLLAGLLAHRVTAPLYHLSRAAREVGDGALGTQVPVETGGEVGATLTAFNRMSHHLQNLDADARRLRAREHLGEIGEVASGLAHSLRNPLNALGLSLESLTSAQSEEEKSRLSDAARRQIRRMDAALRSFLALASGGGGEPEPVSVPALLRDVALEALQDANGGRVRVDVQVAQAGDDVPEAPLLAVAPELRAVLQALVINAVEASPAESSVTVTTKALDDGRWRVEVLDRGPGLPEVVRQRLFTPHTSTKAHGSGMGLYLAKRIASDRYDGDLQLMDREGGGTRALLELGPRCASPSKEVSIA